jgi:hypothetical protein
MMRQFMLTSTSSSTKTLGMGRVQAPRLDFLICVAIIPFASWWEKA